MKMASNFYSVKAIHKALDRTVRNYCEPNKKYMVTFLTYHPLKCKVAEASLYAETLQWDFEGYRMPVPSGYDEILTTIYGDYMTPPPVEKRVFKHHFYDGNH